MPTSGSIGTRKNPRCCNMFILISDKIIIIIIIIITVNICSTFLWETSNALNVLVWGKEECLKMTFESLKGKINVLDIVRRRVPDPLSWNLCVSMSVLVEQFYGFVSAACNTCLLCEVTNYCSACCLAQHHVSVHIVYSILFTDVLAYTLHRQCIYLWDLATKIMVVHMQL